MPRLEPLDLKNLSPEQQAVADAIVAGPRGGLRGPFDAWLRAPELAQRAQMLGEYCRFGTSLTRDMSELAILITGKHWKAQFEFWAHARLAREAGVDEGIIEAVRTGVQPAFGSTKPAALYDFVTEYLGTNRVSAATYASVLAEFGERGVVDIIGVVGYYGLVSMTLNVFEVSLPPGETDPLS